jgi:predicted dehydrogenase
VSVEGRVEAEALRLGFIGCGMIAKTHARALTRMQGVEVAALSDTNPQAIRGLKEAVPQLASAREYSDYVEMLDREQLDGVLILTPHSLHLEQIKAALKRKLNIFVEKPMVTSPAEAREVLRSLEGSGLVLCVGYQRRTDGLFRYVKDTASDAGLGAPRYIEHQLSQDWTGLSRGSWRMDPRLSGGGFLMDSGSHIMDMVLWLMGGLPRRVYAVVRRDGFGVEVVSSVVAESDGCVASISLMGDAPFWSERLRVYCPGGVVCYLDENQSRKVWAVDRSNRVMDASQSLPSSSTPAENFVRAVRGLEAPAAGAREGLMVAEFTEACYRSAEAGEPVLLGDYPGP